MTKRQLYFKLRKIKRDYGGDPETAHAKADEALLEYINDEQVSVAYEDVPKWYA